MEIEKLADELEKMSATVNYAKAHKIEEVTGKEAEIGEFLDLLMSSLKVVHEHQALLRAHGETSEALNIDRISLKRAHVALLLWDTLFPGNLEALEATAGTQVTEAVKATRRALGR